MAAARAQLGIAEGNTGAIQGNAGGPIEDLPIIERNRTGAGSADQAAGFDGKAATKQGSHANAAIEASVGNGYIAAGIE